MRVTFSKKRFNWNLAKLFSFVLTFLVLRYTIAEGQGRKLIVDHLDNATSAYETATTNLNIASMDHELKKTQHHTALCNLASTKMDRGMEVSNESLDKCNLKQAVQFNNIEPVVEKPLPPSSDHDTTLKSKKYNGMVTAYKHGAKIQIEGYRINNIIDVANEYGFLPQDLLGMCIKESTTCRDDAVGDNGIAIGAYQIQNQHGLSHKARRNFLLATEWTVKRAIRYGYNMNDRNDRFIGIRSHNRNDWRANDYANSVMSLSSENSFLFNQ